MLSFNSHYIGISSATIPRLPLLVNEEGDFQFPLYWDFFCNRGPFGQFGARIARFGHRPGAGPRLSLNCMALYKDNRKFGIVYSIMDGWRAPATRLGRAAGSHMGGLGQCRALGGFKSRSGSSRGAAPSNPNPGSPSRDSIGPRAGGSLGGGSVGGAAAGIRTRVTGWPPGRWEASVLDQAGLRPLPHSSALLQIYTFLRPAGIR